MGSRWVHASKEISLMTARQGKEESARSTTKVQPSFGKPFFTPRNRYDTGTKYVWHCNFNSFLLA
jgi:hypothetical protein